MAKLLSEPVRVLWLSLTMRHLLQHFMVFFMASTVQETIGAKMHLSHNALVCQMASIFLGFPMHQ